MIQKLCRLKFDELPRPITSCSVVRLHGLLPLERMVMKTAGVKAVAANEISGHCAQTFNP